MIEGALTKIALPDLRDLLQAIRLGHLEPPLTRTALISHGFSQIADDVLAVLDDLDLVGTTVALATAIAEREHAQTHAPRVELVWTGPEPVRAAARDTAIVVRQMFADAQRSVLIAGFSFDHAADILAPLHASMRDRGVTAAIFVDVARPQHGDGDPEAVGAAAVGAFLTAHWPFGPPFPSVYYDPRTATAGVYASLHAKCVVVDERLTLVTSANFTDRGQTRNIEVGVLIDDAALAAELGGQWWNLVSEGLVREG